MLSPLTRNPSPSWTGGTGLTALITGSVNVTWTESGHNVPPDPFTSPNRRPVPETRPPPSHVPNSPEPMQLGRSRLTPEERECHFRENLCLYCGGSGHKALKCSIKLGSLASPPASHSLTTARITVNHKSSQVPIFIDSGSDVNFIGMSFVHRLQIPVVLLTQLSKVHSLNDQLLHEVSLRTQDISDH